MAPSRNTNDHEGVIELCETKNSNNTSDGGDIDIDDKIRDAYDQEAMRGGSKTDDSASFEASRKDGHQRLPSHATDDFEPRPESIASTEVIENATGAAGDGDDGAGVVYKVYKRRWFGLVQLTLLNIIVSWDVSCAALFRSLFFLELVSCATAHVMFKKGKKKVMLTYIHNACTK